MIQDITLEEKLFERANILSIKTGKKARIMVTDDLNNDLYENIAYDVYDFAELFPVDISSVKQDLSLHKGFTTDLYNEQERRKGTGNVNQVLDMIRNSFGIEEKDILPFISGSLKLKSGEADALLGGLDAPTEALIAGCSLVLNYRTPSAIFFTQVNKLKSSGSVKKRDNNIFELVMPDDKRAIIAYPENRNVEEITDAAIHASGNIPDPVTAFISFSTSGNSNYNHPILMKTACKAYFHSGCNGLCYGDIQLDAALNSQVLHKKLNGEDPFNGRTANCLIYSDATGAHSIIDYFEWASNNYSNREGAILAIADMALKPEPAAIQLSQIIMDSIFTYSIVTGKLPKVALIAHDDMYFTKFQKVIDILPEQGKSCLCRDKIVSLKQALEEADLFIYPELAQGNPAYKAWQLLNPGFFVIQGFDKPVCDLSRGDEKYNSKIKSTIAYLTIQALDMRDN